MNQLNTDTYLLNKVERAKEFKMFSSVGGRYFMKAIRTGLSGAVGARAENAALPTAGNYSYQPIQIKEAFQYGVVQLSGVVMNNSKGDKNAFAEALKTTMDGMYDRTVPRRGDAAVRTVPDYWERLS